MEFFHAMVVCENTNWEIRYCETEQYERFGSLHYLLKKHQIFLQKLVGIGLFRRRRARPATSAGGPAEAVSHAVATIRVGPKGGPGGPGTVTPVVHS